MLGDAWYTDPTLNPSSDPSSFTPVQANYYRAKIIEFQILLQSLDECAQNAQGLIDSEIDPALSADLSDMLSNFDAKKYAFRAAAESLNLAVNGLNMVGAEFPIVEIPSGLGAVPLVALAAVLGVTATLVVWGREWITGYNARLKQSAQLDAISDPDKRATLATAMAAADAAQQAAEVSPLSNIAGMVKWIALGAVAYFAWNAYENHNRRIA